LPNGVGVIIRNAAQNTVGGNVVPDDCNIISGNGVGVQIDQGASENTILNNFIGTSGGQGDAIDLANAEGVAIEGSPANIGAGNVISAIDNLAVIVPAG